MVGQAEKLSGATQDLPALEEAFRTLTMEAAEEHVSKSERLELDHALSGVRGAIERLHEAQIAPTLAEEEIVAELAVVPTSKM